MEAVWGVDYDIHSDKCYQCPCCPECREPIGLAEDGKYHCYDCREIVEVKDPKMIEWLQLSRETKVEMQDCEQIFTKDGQHLSGCGGKNCVRVVYRRNPIDFNKWDCAYGRCEKCGSRFIV